MATRPSGRGPASLVQASLRVGGLIIALVQGAALPLLNLAADPDVPVSLPALALAGGMMGVAEAIKRDRRRRDDS